MNIDLAAQRAIERLNRSGFDSLTDLEKTLATVWLFEAKVANDGFERWFSTVAGDIAFHAPAALKTIGAGQMAEIAAKANSVFGPDGPPQAREARAALVQILAESARQDLAALQDLFYRCPDDVDELLELYVAKTKDG